MNILYEKKAEEFQTNTLPNMFQEQLLERSRRLRVKRNQIIVSETSPSTDVYFITKGKVQISLISKSGREAILREIGPREIFGELPAIDRRPRSANAIALVESELAAVDASSFRSFLLEVPGAGFWMASKLTRFVRDLTDRTFELSTMSVGNRVLSELLRLCEKNGVSDDRCEIREFPTHSDLAALIGTHREAVTRELSWLTSEAVIKQSGRRLLVLSVSRLNNILASTLR